MASLPNVRGRGSNRGFVNDQYWLLLPFHVVWDGGAAVEDVGMQKVPLGDGSADKIVLEIPVRGRILAR